tara:strand:- start:106 stop:450 length:345 start_codon:yes stop_codon:yes gene_type:complete
MSKQETHKTEILLGSRSTFSDGESIGYHNRPIWENTYTLIIDGKFNSGGKNGKPDEVATRYATNLKRQGISNYSLINGERIRFTNFERIKVSPMDQRDIDIFKETLEAKLKELA